MGRSPFLRRWIVAAAVATALAGGASCGPPLPDPPVAVDDANRSPHDALLSVPAPGVLANDTLNGGTVDAGARTTTGGGEVTLFADGSFQYQPQPGFGGIDTFTYTLTNAGATSEPATVSIEVPAARWVGLPDLPVAAARSAAAVVDGVVYVFGGEIVGSAHNEQVFAYDRAVGAWEAGATAMPMPVSNVCAVAMGAQVYLPGGYTGAARVADLQVYDTATGTWSLVDSDPLPRAQAAHACAAHGGRLYLFGGDETGTAATPSAWRYDPSDAPGTRWTALAPVPTAVRYAAAVTIGAQVFVLGGMDAVGNSARVFAYEPASNAWTEYPELQTARSGAGAWVSGPYLYVGGGGWSTVLTSVERYATVLGAAGTWTDADPLGVGRRTFAFATDREAGLFFAVGGWSGQYLASAEEGFLRAWTP